MPMLGYCFLLLLKPREFVSAKRSGRTKTGATMSRRSTCKWDFEQDAKALSEVVEEMETFKMVQQFKKLRLDQFEAYVEERLVITDPLKCSLQLASQSERSQAQLSTNCSLFSRLCRYAMVILMSYSSM